MLKKKYMLIVITLFLSLILISLLIWTYKIQKIRSSFSNDILSFAKKNEKIVFSINKCIFFSSSDSKNKTSSSTNFTIENLYQYTDIALFINNNSDDNSLENTLKKVKINNINYNVMPLLGMPKLYYKNINNFAKSEIINENIIDNELNFEITSEDNTDLSRPILYNNCANPITLSYINSNIKSDYTITDTASPLTYDGSLLKKCNILLDSISCNLSFDIYITNNLEQEFKCTINMQIPLKNENNSIFDGSFISKNDTNYIFYRYK